MIAFETYDKCPKCTEERFGMKFADRYSKFGITYHRSPMFEGVCDKTKKLYLPDVGVTIDIPEDGIPIEHLHIKCSKCGYEWIEGVAGAREEDE